MQLHPIVALLICTFVVALASKQPFPVVWTRHAVIKGSITSNGGAHFLGIPYAKPPLGALRWKAPEPVTGFSFVDATSYGPSCFQPITSWVPQVSEDCLSLNVFVPSSVGKKGFETASWSNLPVRIWIHGGGFVDGGSIEFPADDLAEESNTIIVSINYRLNVFGFGVTSAALAESTEVNYGLQDQRLALKWVKENIAHFGGDSRKVMLSGESAGAMSIMLHMVTPVSWPYFSSIAIESSAIWKLYPSTFKAEITDEYLAEAQSVTGCAPSDLACLRTLDANLLTNLLYPVEFGLPTLDSVLQQPPLELWLTGATKPHTPILLGINSDEGKGLAADAQVADVDMLETLLFLYGLDTPQSIAAAMQYYNIGPNPDFGNYFGTDFANLAHMIGEGIVVCGTLIAAEAAAKHHEMYTYYFTHATVNDPLAQVLGAYHGIEIPYVFGFTFDDLTTDELQLSAEMISYWTNFHVTFNPNKHANNNPNKSPLYHWPAYKDTSIEFALPLSETQINYPSCEAFWKPYLLSSSFNRFNSSSLKYPVANIRPLDSGAFGRIPKGRSGQTHASK